MVGTVALWKTGNEQITGLRGESHRLEEIRSGLDDAKIDLRCPSLVLRHLDLQQPMFNPVQLIHVP